MCVSAHQRSGSFPAQQYLVPDNIVKIPLGSILDSDLAGPYLGLILGFGLLWALLCMLELVHCLNWRELLWSIFMWICMLRIVWLLVPRGVVFHVVHVRGFLVSNILADWLSRFCLISMERIIDVASFHLILETFNYEGGSVCIAVEPAPSLMCGSVPWSQGSRGEGLSTWLLELKYIYLLSCLIIYIQNDKYIICFLWVLYFIIAL